MNTSKLISKGHHSQLSYQLKGWRALKKTFQRLVNMSFTNLMIISFILAKHKLIRKKILSFKVLQLHILSQVQITGIPKNIKGSIWNYYLFLSINWSIVWAFFRVKNGHRKNILWSASLCIYFMATIITDKLSVQVQSPDKHIPISI